MVRLHCTKTWKSTIFYATKFLANIKPPQKSVNLRQNASFSQQFPLNATIFNKLAKCLEKRVKSQEKSVNKGHNSTNHGNPVNNVQPITANSSHMELFGANWCNYELFGDMGSI